MTAAMGTPWRQLRERHALVAPWRRAIRATLEAFELPQRAVQAHQFARPRAAVQIVNVLRDEMETVVPRPSREHVMRRIRTARGHLLPAPGIPLPDERGIAGECLRRREILRPVAAPQSFRAAKGRHAARRGDAGARYRCHTACGCDAGREIRKGGISHNLHVTSFDPAALFNEYGDLGLVRELAQLLVDTTPPQLEAIRSAVAARDAVAPRAAAHHLRGSLVAFGVPDAVETARALEAMGSAGDLTGAEALRTSLASDVQSLRESAEAWLNSNTPSTNR